MIRALLSLGVVFVIAVALLIGYAMTLHQNRTRREAVTWEDRARTAEHALGKIAEEVRTLEAVGNDVFGLRTILADYEDNRSVDAATATDRNDRKRTHTS